MTFKNLIIDAIYCIEPVLLYFCFFFAGKAFGNSSFISDDFKNAMWIMIGVIGFVAFLVSGVNGIRFVNDTIKWYMK